MFTPDTKIQDLDKIGPAYQIKLNKLKIKTLRDLFYHFPHRYEDFSQTVAIADLKENQQATVCGKITETSLTRTWKKRLSIFEAIIKDASGSIKAVWFNQPYLADALTKNKTVSLSGKLVFKKNALYFSNPAYEIISYQNARIHTGRLVPVYPETAGLTSRWLRRAIKSFLPFAKNLPDFLPAVIKKQYRLPDLNQAIAQIHFPDNLALARRARRRLAFDELFLIQLTGLRQKKILAQESALAIPFNEKLVKTFVQKLPFKLTDDQRVAAWEIFQDLTKGRPMNRLLNGDVGSGKTIVCLLAALQVAKAGYQTALMAPTEILARQHYETFTKLLKSYKLKIALITAAEKKIPPRQADIVIGTHALLQEKISFKNLALAIVDEQHRFGVAQRAALQKKTCPHLLSMTATPIPRTLALTVYGDLDISLIKELPKGRKKIGTQIIAPDQRAQSYEFIRQEAKRGRQGFVICPLIEESSKLIEVKSVKQEYEKLSREIFPDLKIAMLHGRLKPKEKEKTLADFRNKKSDLLVATSVVEVGMDIPNATVMMIEGADRFGLAQLHQFRGRVGRSRHQSYCLLFTDTNNAKTNQRLKALVKSQDGFELAEKDLKLRGPGDFLGTRQWGLPNLTMAALDDLELIKAARQAARHTLDKNLLSPALVQKLAEFGQNIHLE